MYCGNNPLVYVDPWGNWQVGDGDLPFAAQLQLLALTKAYYDADIKYRNEIAKAANAVREAYKNYTILHSMETPIVKAMEEAANAGYMDRSVVCRIFSSNHVSVTASNRNDYSTYTLNIKLPNPNLVTIQDDDSGTIYAGGNQEWNDFWFVKNTGCGSTSLTNIYLYYYLSAEGNPNKTILKSEYEAWYNQLVSEGMSVFQLGQFASEGEKLLSDYDLTAQRVFGAVTGDNGALEEVAYALLNGNPVALQNVTADKGSGVTPWHWVTITSLHVNPFAYEAARIDFSSWGELHDARSDEYYNYNFYDAWNSLANLVYFHD